MQDLTLKIQRSHHVSQLMTIISQWKTAQNEAIKNLREQETIRRTATGSTAADAAVAGATIAGGTLLGTGFGLLLSPFTFGVSIPVGIAIGTARGLCTLSLSRALFSSTLIVWADNADGCARQYAGTGALKTDFTRQVRVK